MYNTTRRLGSYVALAPFSGLQRVFESIYVLCFSPRWYITSALVYASLTYKFKCLYIWIKYFLNFLFHEDICHSTYLLHRQNLVFTKLNTSKLLNRLVAFKVLSHSCSYLLQAIQKRANRDSKFSFISYCSILPFNAAFHFVVVLYSHPSLTANCFSLTSINQYIANVIKQESWVLLCPKNKDVISFSRY